MISWGRVFVGQENWPFPAPQKLLCKYPPTTYTYRFHAPLPPTYQPSNLYIRSTHLLSWVPWKKLKAQATGTECCFYHLELLDYLSNDAFLLLRPNGLAYHIYRFYMFSMVYYLQHHCPNCRWTPPHHVPQGAYRSLRTQAIASRKRWFYLEDWLSL